MSSTLGLALGLVVGSMSSELGVCIGSSSRLVSILNVTNVSGKFPMYKVNLVMAVVIPL